MSRGTAAWMRQVGGEAQTLEGGFEVWQRAHQPLLCADKLPTPDAAGPDHMGDASSPQGRCRPFDRTPEQRAVFQPTGVATFLMSITVFGSAGLVTPETVRLFLIGLPVLLAGTLLGWALYGKLDGIMLLITGR